MNHRELEEKYHDERWPDDDEEATEEEYRQKLASQARNIYVAMYPEKHDKPSTEEDKRLIGRIMSVLGD